jgi:glycerol-3-phosphate acyltransferase PlsY
MLTLLILVAAFLAGSIPFGFLIGKSQGKDIRKEGSGNIGATNVWRILGPTWGTVSFILDVAKGALVPALVNLLALKGDWGITTMDLATAAGVMSVLGHMFSPFMGFKGGKGIATGLGALLGTAPLVGLCGFGVWIGVMFMGQYVSISSLVAVIGVVAFAFFFRQSPFFIGVYALVGIYVYIKHIPNIKRFLNGEEPRFSFSRPKAPESPPPA